MNSVLPEPARALAAAARRPDRPVLRHRGVLVFATGDCCSGATMAPKSKVLALTLPFLLTVHSSPHWVEPDADPKKRMEWNLLLGGAHPYPERLGYTWIEFGRVDDHGEQHFRTPRLWPEGCLRPGGGMQLVLRHVPPGRRGPRPWWTRRHGADQRPLDRRTQRPRHRVRPRPRLRRAVDECLFGFGEQRYGALVELLIRLRRPQLSKKPSEKALSDALTDALPPLDQAVIADVAEAFRSLEEDRDALRAMTDARDAATSFLSHYRRYAQIAARQRSRLPRDAQSSYERTNRDLTAAEADQQRAEQALAAAKERQLEPSAEQRRLRSRDEALRASPDMRSARELERAADDARRLDEEAGRAGGERDLVQRGRSPSSRSAKSQRSPASTTPSRRCWRLAERPRGRGRRADRL